MNKEDISKYKEEVAIELSSDDTLGLKELEGLCKNIRKKITNSPRKEILIRDNYRCVLCGDSEDIQVHHLKPVICNGKNSYWNLICLCKYCHWYIHANPKFISNQSKLIKKSVIRKDGITLSYKGNKWGRKSIDVKKEVLKLHKEGRSIREISKQIYYWDKTRHKKFLSIGGIYNIIHEAQYPNSMPQQTQSTHESKENNN